ncbi:hypothetical protein C9374_003072 [Naegleria lovaniensis]|uniref:Uncharacterized protein n=1 Tax=Naegleria lovaniensis TaxID=51637 RepID=A0AA88GTD2_NAELO|nr:uncharacterized protein C9374_003072 [Naegleria lovaniensis]KAG2385923.1 hypothetical protein C9374_003072 [Naegleria lovaniensis]
MSHHQYTYLSNPASSNLTVMSTPKRTNNNTCCPPDQFLIYKQAKETQRRDAHNERLVSSYQGLNQQPSQKTHHSVCRRLIFEEEEELFVEKSNDRMTTTTSNNSSFFQYSIQLPHNTHRVSHP